MTINTPRKIYMYRIKINYADTFNFQVFIFFFDYISKIFGGFFCFERKEKEKCETYFKLMINVTIRLCERIHLYIYI